jgi:hypothetical protein
LQPKTGREEFIHLPYYDKKGEGLKALQAKVSKM